MPLSGRAETFATKIGYLSTSNQEVSYQGKSINGVRFEAILPIRVDEFIHSTSSIFLEYEKGDETKANAFGILEKVGVMTRFSDDIQLFSYLGFGLGYSSAQYPFREKGIDTEERTQFILADIHFGLEFHIEKNFGLGFSYATREAVGAEKVSRLGSEIDKNINSSSRSSFDLIFRF